MNLEPGTLLSFGSVLVAVAGGWFTIGYRVRQLEGAAKEAKAEREALRKLVEEQRTTLDVVRTDQGKRIGAVETDTAILKGKFEVFERLTRRSRTAAGGHPVVPGGSST